MSRYQIQISARIVQWPPQCACCTGPADSQLRATTTRTTSKRLVTRARRSWNIPYCATCLAHIRKQRAGKSTLRTGIVLAIALAFLATFTIDNGLAVGLVAGLLLAGSISRSRSLKQQARSMTIPDACPSPDVAVEYLEWYGILHTFVFTNPAYLEAFLIANDQKQHSDVRQVP